MVRIVRIVRREERIGRKRWDRFRVGDDPPGIVCPLERSRLARQTFDVPK
jgi:hypothetical protein